MGEILNYLVHIDKYLINFVATYGIWIYPALFLIIFSETGLVVLPFLPGDSLLFAVGSLSAHANAMLDVITLFLCLSFAAVLGNQVNYAIGRSVGPAIFEKPSSRIFNKKHLLKAHDFYEKNGGKTIVMARFIPVIRSFVPFVAGVSVMSRRPFVWYNLLSAILWVGSLLGCGYFFGGIPLIRDNFTLVIYLIVLLSLCPPLIAFLRSRRRHCELGL